MVERATRAAQEERFDSRDLAAVWRAVTPGRWLGALGTNRPRPNGGTVPWQDGADPEELERYVRDAAGTV
ncbi:hypothetical protein [Streptomyces bullii]|uniref:Uncharacterized protein n=1 Tax=Streptomyces bullii TaxID=349910 RepID=A0ABW0UII9_9ACTN